VSRLVPALSRMYRLLLYLYPPSYLAEYGEELMEVYEQALRDAAQDGFWGVISQASRELRDLPGVLIRLYQPLRLPDMLTPLFPQTSDQTPWPTALLSMLLFVITGPLAIIQSYHPGWDPQRAPWVFPLVMILGGLAICTGLAIGVVKNFPRWSYPYATYAVFLLTFLATYWINRTPWDINHEGWVLFVVVGVSILVTWWLPAFRPFYANLRRDWTLLSYGLYACTLFILGTHDSDESPVLNLWVVLPSLIGIVGALAHLRLASATRRFGVLLLSMSVGVFIWWSPVFGGMTGTWQGTLVVTGILLMIWGILGALIIAPILVGVFNLLGSRLKVES
jgi:hypothetical protein